ncbi:Importin-9 [Bienertia sinuspersici]
MEFNKAIKNAPGCIQPLVSRVVPYVGPILSQPKQQPDGLVAGSLDLVTMLLKNAPGPVIKALYDVCFNPIIQIVLQSDDHSEMQNATECLAAFVCGGKNELLAWGGDPGFTMRSLLDALSRLLDPVLESSGSFFVGNYILQLILNLPSQMEQHIQDLVSALVRRMQSCEISGLKNSLLLVFARLVHMSVPNVSHFIDMLVSIPGYGDRNSFDYVMSEWVKQQGEVQGSYQIKVTTSALALLLSSRHEELTKNFVQGHLVQVLFVSVVSITRYRYGGDVLTTGFGIHFLGTARWARSTAGIRTRSKAKSTPEQWTVMPLNAKVLSLSHVLPVS